jgi:integrase/recombinase XerC
MGRFFKIDTAFDTEMHKIIRNGEHPYSLPELHDYNGDTSKRWYIDCYVWNADIGNIFKYRKWIPAKYKTAKERRVWATVMIKKITKQLIEGFVFTKKDNPVTTRELHNKPTYLKEAIEKILEDKKGSIRTKSLGSYTSVVNKFFGFLKDNKQLTFLLKDVSPTLAYQYQRHLIKIGNNNTTTNTAISVIRRLINVAVYKGWLTKNDFSTKALTETDSTANTPFTKEDAHNLEEYMKSNNIRLYYFTRFVYWAFIRPKEIRNLKVSDIDLEQKTIFVRGEVSKNRRNEVLPINTKLWQVLIEMKLHECQSTDYIFGNKLLTCAKQQAENHAYGHHLKALINCNLDKKNYTLYSWKHTGVVNAYKAGMDLKRLQTLLRHYNLEMTDIYLKSMGIFTSKHGTDIDW